MIAVKLRKPRWSSGPGYPAEPTRIHFQPTQPAIFWKLLEDSGNLGMTGIAHLASPVEDIARISQDFYPSPYLVKINTLRLIGVL
jgi:hypothetical protein